MRKIHILGLGLLVTGLAAAGCAEEPDAFRVDTAELSSVVWTNAVNVDVAGSNLTKTGTNAWNGGAISVATLSEDGAVEFTTAESNLGKLCGLSNGDSSQHYNDVDFGILLSANGVVRVYEGGTLRGTFGAYAPGDVFRVAVAGGVVSYYHDDALFYTSSGSPIFPLVVDTALLQPGATINEVQFGSPAFFENTVNVSVVDHSLTKVGAIGWDAGAISSSPLPSAGLVQFTTNETNKAKVGGISLDDPDQNYTSIDYAIFLASSGDVRIFENGVRRGTTFGSYVAGDVFAVQVLDGVVTYTKNGVMFYTSTVPATGPYFFDAALNHDGATIVNVTIGELN